MQDDDVRDQLEALRREVRALSNAFIDLRHEDVRRVYGNQIRTILMERIERFISKSEEKALSDTGDKEKYKAKLISLIDRSISSYERNGKDEATRFLDDYESNLDIEGSSSNPSTSFVLDLTKGLRDYFETSEAILHRSESSKSLVGLPMGVKKSPLSPLEVEKALGPLANSWRVNILMTLSKDDESLAVLSNVLGLKKGHLQFHLRCLLDTDYIGYDRKSHLYSITEKGSIALNGVTELIDKLASREC